MSVAPSVTRTHLGMIVPGREMLEKLTVREFEALRYIGQGLPDKNIAKVMGISIHTCRGYIKGVYAKLQVNTQIEAVNRARQLRLLDD